MRLPPMLLTFALALVVAGNRAAAQVVQTVTLDGVLGTPDGMTIGSGGHLYIADFGGGQGRRVLRVQGGNVYTVADGLSAPDGLAFDRDEALYISSFNAGTVHRLKNLAVTAYATGLDHPSGLAFGPDGSLYVANFGNFDGTTVSRVLPDGTVSTYARGFSAPLGIAFGPDGLLYVGNYNTGTIHRVRANGTIEVFAQVSNTPIAQLQYLAFDSRGTLLVPSLGHNRIYAIDRRGRVSVFAGGDVAGFADGAPKNARFHTPNSIAIRGDTVWVTEFRSGRLRRIVPGSATTAPVVLATARLDPTRLVDDSALYRIVQQSGQTRRRDSIGTVIVTRRVSGNRLTLAQSWNAGAVRSRDTLVLDATTLRPIQRASGPADRRVLSRYDDARVVVGADSMMLPPGTPSFEGAGLDVIVAALQEGDGTSVSLPLFVASQRGVVESEVAIAPTRDDTTEATFAATVSYPNAEMRYRVTERGRRVVAISHDYGSRVLHFERIEVEAPIVVKRDDLIRITAHDFAFSKPARVPGGWMRIRFVNTGREPHYFSIMRVDSTRGASDFIAWRETRTPRPAWLAPASGIATVAPGDSTELLVQILHGRYVVFCGYPSADGRPHFARGMIGELFVDGGPRSAKQPQTRNEVVLHDGRIFAPGPIAADSGTQVMRVVNRGEQLHQLLIARLPDGVTAEDELAWFTNGFRGPRPGLPASGVIQIPSGDAVWLTTTLKPGTYLLFCALTGADGQPHHARGMHTLLKVY